MSLRINNNLYSYYSYACDIPYSILGMDFILTHVNNFNFATNKVTLDDGTSLDLLLSDPTSDQLVSSIQDVKHLSNSVSLTQIIPKNTLKRAKQVLINNVTTNEQLTPNDFEQLFEEFPQIADENTFKRKPKHKTKHYIKTHGQPVKCKPRRLDAENIAILKEVMNDLMEKGIVRRSKSNYASPLVLVKKPGKKPRPCGDYSSLNKITLDDAYSMRHIHDVNLEVHGCKYFSKIDLVKAYNQIPIAESDIHKTAVATPIGLFEWVRMPFGLCTAAQTFQRFIDEILEDVPSNFPYQDDVLVYTPTIEQHYDTLHQIFKKFDENGVIINKDKSELCRDKVTVLGYEINESGIKPSIEKREVVDAVGQPVTEDQLHTFVGVVNYYNRFIPGCSLILAPLYKLFTSKKKCKKEIKWTPEGERSFRLAKNALNEVCLAHPDYSKEIAIMIDASDYGIGGVIQQLEGDTWRPIQYFARKLSKTEQRYSTFGRELLAAFASAKKFRHHVEGREFTLFTDHLALVSAINKPHLNQKRVDREERQLDFLCSLVKPGRAKHIPGKENIIADCLSRALHNIWFPEEIDLLDIYKEQQADQALLNLDKDSFVTRTLDLPNGKIKLIYNTETGYDRLCIPATKRKEIFDRYHDMSHRGIKASKRYLSHRYYWPNMSSEIASWIKQCIPCGQAKSGPKVQAPLGKFEADLDRFHTIHIDIITMDKEINGCKNVLTMIDRATSWPDAVPLNCVDAKTVAWNIYNTWIKNLGVPKVIVTDQGKQFESELFKALCNLLGTKRCRTTPYHPQANAKIERFHRTFKEGLMATSPDDWYTALPLVILALRNSYKEDLNATPASLVYGKDLTLPNELIAKPIEAGKLPPDFAKRLGEVLNRVKSKPTKPHGHEKPNVPKELMEATHVFMAKGQFSKKGPRNSGPHEVVKRSMNTFDIKRGNEVITVSIDHLKPASISSNESTMSKSVQIAKKAKQKSLASISRTETSKDSTKNAENPKDESKRMTPEISKVDKSKKRGRPKKAEKDAAPASKSKPAKSNTNPDNIRTLRNGKKA